MGKNDSDFESEKNNSEDFGEKVFEWRAYDYYPHQRGIVWIIVFCFFVFGSAILLWFLPTQEIGGAWITDMKTSNFFMAFTLFLAAGVYFYTHQKGEEEQNIQVFENGMLIDNTFILREEIDGFWFVYEPGVSVVNIEKKPKKHRKPQVISLQMGPNEPDFFQEGFRILGIPQKFDREEGLLDKWIRILKL